MARGVIEPIDLTFEDAVQKVVNPKKKKKYGKIIAQQPSSPKTRRNTSG